MTNDKFPALFSIQLSELRIQVSERVFLLLAVALISSGLNRCQGARAQQQKAVALRLEFALLWCKCCFCGSLRFGFTRTDLLFDGLAFPSSCHAGIIDV